MSIAGPMFPECLNLPKAYHGCTCACHRTPGMVHCVPCCTPVLNFPWTKAMQIVPVQIYSESRHPLPSYAHLYDSGMDVFANLADSLTVLHIAVKETVIVPTGLFVAIPPGYELQVRPRSGTSRKTPMRIANAPGTVDSPYRGEVGIIITNTGDEPVTVNDGERIAQIVLAPVVQCEWVPVTSKEELGSTERGEGGFGSTGQ